VSGRQKSSTVGASLTNLRPHQMPKHPRYTPLARRHTPTHMHAKTHKDGGQDRGRVPQGIKSAKSPCPKRARLILGVSMSPTALATLSTKTCLHMSTSYISAPIYLERARGRGREREREEVGGNESERAREADTASKPASQTSRAGASRRDS